MSRIVVTIAETDRSTVSDGHINARSKLTADLNGCVAIWIDQLDRDTAGGGAGGFRRFVLVAFHGCLTPRLECVVGETLPQHRELHKPLPA
jgi:hypothetical protein